MTVARWRTDRLVGSGVGGRCLVHGRRRVHRHHDRVRVAEQVAGRSQTSNWKVSVAGPGRRREHGVAVLAPVRVTAVPARLGPRVGERVAIRIGRARRQVDRRPRRTGTVWSVPALAVGASFPATAGFTVTTTVSVSQSGAGSAADHPTGRSTSASPGAGRRRERRGRRVGARQGDRRAARLGPRVGERVAIRIGRARAGQVDRRPTGGPGPSGRLRRWRSVLWFRATAGVTVTTTVSVSQSAGSPRADRRPRAQRQRRRPGRRRELGVAVLAPVRVTGGPSLGPRVGERVAIRIGRARAVQVDRRPRRSWTVWSGPALAVGASFVGPGSMSWYRTTRRIDQRDRPRIRWRSPCRGRNGTAR